MRRKYGVAEYSDSHPSEAQIDPSPSPSPTRGGEQESVPPTLAPDGARGLGLAIPHLSENHYIQQRRKYFPISPIFPTGFDATPQTLQTWECNLNED